MSSLSNFSSPSKIDRVNGMIYGVAMGDALGIPHEFFRVTPKLNYTGIINTDHELIVQWQYQSTTIAPASISDDTAMTLAMLEELLDNNMKYDSNRMSMAYMKFANFSKVGMGRNTRRLFKGVKTLNGYKSRYKKFYSELTDCESNGSLMRASPLVLLTKLEDDHMLSNPTQANADCNKIYYTLMQGIYKGVDKEQLKGDLLKLENINLEVSQAVRDSVDSSISRDITGKYKGWVVNSLYIALKCFWKYDTMEDAMSHINQITGSDTDTNAAVCGSLFGAYLGLSGLQKEKFTSKNIEIINTHCPMGSKIKELLQRYESYLNVKE